MLLLPYVAVLAALPVAHSARILAVLPLGARSHHGFLQTVARTLARAGHEVEVYSPFPHILGDQPANLTHHHLEGIRVIDQSKDMDYAIQEITDYPLWKCLDLFWGFVDDFYNEFYSDKAIKKLLTSGKHFDLIILEPFNAQEYTLVFSHIFKAPVIGLQATPTGNVINTALGNSLSLSYIPDVCTPFSDKMSLTERMMNAFSSVRGIYYHFNHHFDQIDGLIKKDFPDTPPLRELTKSISLMFVNDHLTADYAQPRPSNIIPVGGIHIQPPQPLPQDIKQFMDNAMDGVIFFSLGTYVIDDIKPKEYFDMYINVFKKLKQNILWKTRKLNIEGLPENVKILQWAPQKDILAHPNCVLFITHGSQNSLLETLHFGVPVISIPQFFDQHRNSEFFVRKGVGLRIPIQDITEETITTALRKVLGDPSYRENMKRLSAIFRDRPLSPAESVVFWTEYVLRHGGAAHLRPASTELQWYQLFVVDVLAAMIFTISLVFCILFLFLRKVLPNFKSKESHLTNKKTN